MYPDDRAIRALDPATLAFARFEPGWTLTQRCTLDIGFRSAGRWIIIANCEVDVSMLLERETSPILWPLAVAELGDECAEEIERALYPWLRLQIFNRRASAESFEYLQPNARDEVERARAIHLLGATPYHILYPDLAPYVYALRHARNARIAISDPFGGNGALLLTRAGARIDLDLESSESRALAVRWLGLEVGETASEIEYDCSVASTAPSAARARIRILRDGGEHGDVAIPVTLSLPPTLTVSFDPDDAPVATKLGVHLYGAALAARSTTLSEPVPKGGSAGRIAMLVRDDALRNPDADVAAMQVLARRLEREGFEVAIFPAGARADLAPFDLVHAWGAELAASALELLSALPAMPVVWSLNIEDERGEAFSGPKMMEAVYGNLNDAGNSDIYFDAVAARRLSIESQVPERASNGDATTAAIRAFLSRTDVVLLSCAAEEQLLRSRFSYGGMVLPIPALIDASIEPIEARVLAGEADFILCDAPIEPLRNQIALAYAADSLNLPLVLIGAVIDQKWFQVMTDLLGPTATWIPSRHLNEGIRSWLRGRARVIADCSWSGRGLHRIAAATATGAVPLLSAAGYGREIFGELAEIVDPGSHSEIKAGLERAWGSAPERSEALRSHARKSFDQTSAFIACVTAYKMAGERAPLRHSSAKLP